MSFEGFAKDAPGFWHELSVEMNKTWFDANKPRYQAQWVVPMTQLLLDVSAKLAPVYRGVTLHPPKILRIYRDVRFAKDKTPYKTWIGAAVSAGGDVRKPQDGVVALYIHFGLDEEFVGCGQYVFSDDALVRYRKAVAAPKTGAAIAAVVDKLARGGYGLEAQETLSRVPKPYAADHPRAELLRRKGLTVAFPAIPRGLIHKPALVDWLVEHAKAAAPVSKWVLANVTR